MTLHLKALWINNVDITFVYNDGVTANETVTVTGRPTPFVAPADPTKEGNHFVGWTSDATFEEITGFPAVYRPRIPLITQYSPPLPMIPVIMYRQRIRRASSSSAA